MAGPGARHDGELEASMYRSVSSSASSHARHHGHHYPVPNVEWPKFWQQPSYARFNTSIRPVPEVYPLIFAVSVAFACGAVMIFHDMRWNPEVLVRKDMRSLQVCTKEDDPEAFKRLTRQAEHAYDNPLRRYVLGKKPWIFPWVEERFTGISRQDQTIDLEKDKWRVAREKAAEEHP